MAATRRPTVGAAVDLGSNSVHLLVAAVAAHRLEPLVDESVFLGLGEAVNQRGELGSAARRELVAAMVRYADAGRRLGATSISFLGTEPLRRATDANRIVDEARTAAGAAVHVLSHEEEAYLTLIGVTEGRPVAHETLVVDIGGGSSEFAVVAPGQPAVASGVQLGSARLTSRHVTHDPPTADELAAMTVEAREVLAGAPAASPREIVGVGGTASNLVKVLPAALLDRTLTRRRLADIQAVLAAEPADVAAERHALNPVRARLLPAGGAIVDAILARYGVDRIRVSNASLREGAILAEHHAGNDWRDRLPELAHGWRG
jgi:exopolyphosphatase/pppGpp-phosphohydrolase